MSTPKVFPPQVINLVIDELGDAHWNSSDFSRRRVGAYEALRACALVSKKWTISSRSNLFRKVKIEVHNGQPPRTPLAPILPYIKELEISSGYQPTQIASIAGLLKTFSMSPIEQLGITGGELADKRDCIQEFIVAHSATLRTVEFQNCSVSAYNIMDIAMGRYGLERLRLVDCTTERPSPGHPPIADTQNPGAHSKASDLELCISTDNPMEGPVDVVDMVTQLPCRFSKLNVAHLPTEESPDAMNATTALIKANARALSSLCIHIFAEDMEIEIGPEHMPSLKGCLKLSELTLGMENSESGAVRDTVSILSTLGSARSGRLGKIVLEARYIGRWFNKDGPIQDKEDSEGSDEDYGSDEEGQGRGKEDWGELDVVLSKLAKASLSASVERLTFTLVATQWEGNKKLIPTVRKWLPKLLPRFSELGLLHVHYMQGGGCRTIDDSGRPACMGEDFNDGS